MSISCSACASTEVSDVMAVNLSGPLSLRPHQPVDALRVPPIDFCSAWPPEGNLRHLSPYFSHGAGSRRIARGGVGERASAATVVERGEGVPKGRRCLPAARIYDRTKGKHRSRWGSDRDRPGVLAVRKPGSTAGFEPRPDRRYDAGLDRL